MPYDLPNLNYFDLETTGLNQFHDKITEIAIIKQNLPVDSMPLSEEYTTLVNPGKNISNFITKITGISNEMVVDKPFFKQIIPTIVSFISKGQSSPYLIAHNCDGFDKIVLKTHFKEANMNINEVRTWFYIDTLLMAKKLYPYFFKHNLKDLCLQLGLEIKTAHRALNDTKMLQLLYLRMCSDLEKKNKLSPDFVLYHPDYVWNYINN